MQLKELVTQLFIFFHFSSFFRRLPQASCQVNLDIVHPRVSETLRFLP